MPRRRSRAAAVQSVGVRIPCLAVVAASLAGAAWLQGPGAALPGCRAVGARSGPLRPQARRRHVACYAEAQEEFLQEPSADLAVLPLEEEEGGVEGPIVKPKPPPRTPEQLGFVPSDGGALLVRPARCNRAVRPSKTSATEVGNLKFIKFGLKRGFAVLEVLVDHNTVLGNPFDPAKGKKKCMAAYREFLDLASREDATPEMVESFEDASGRFSIHNCSERWREAYEAAGGLPALQSALSELRQLAISHEARGDCLRLMAHSAPKINNCHAAQLAARLGEGRPMPYLTGSRRQQLAQDLPPMEDGGKVRAPVRASEWAILNAPRFTGASSSMRR